mgnify:CR=1 FL=1
MSHKIIIPRTHPHHQRLTDMINSFAGKYNVLRAFMSYSKTSQKHLIFIHINDRNVPEEVLKSRWIRKALEQCDAHILIMGEQNIRVHVRFGSLYINRHCNASTLIYKKEDYEFTYPELPEQLKKFKQFREDYYNAHDLLSTEIRKAKNSSSLTMEYHIYLSLLQHHVHYLEILCIGEYFSNGSLSERLIRLEDFLPEIKTLMLKKTETTYFIIEALNSAQKADDHEDYMHIKDEFGDAITDTEQKFYYLVDRIFRETKKAVKKPKQKTLIEPKEISPYEPVIKILTKHFNIEEIFIFNQQEVYSADQKTTVLYLLIISNKISNQDHFEMMQVVSQQTEGRFNIVPIAHQKAWIQERLFVHQDFFKKVMVPENSIFRADVPTIMHWVTIDANGETDEGIYYRLCSELHKNYKLLRSQEDQTNEGLGLMLSGFFYRACVIFIYVALRYHPNQINIRILWKLCEHIDPKVKNLDYLIQKLPFDFFEFLNPSKNLFRNFYLLQEEQLAVLDELAQGFLDLVDKQFD